MYLFLMPSRGLMDVFTGRHNRYWLPRFASIQWRWGETSSPFTGYLLAREVKQVAFIPNAVHLADGIRGHE